MSVSAFLKAYIMYLHNILEFRNLDLYNMTFNSLVAYKLALLGLGLHLACLNNLLLSLLNISSTALGINLTDSKFFNKIKSLI